MKRNSAGTLADHLSEEELVRLQHEWAFWARKEQLPPPTDWTTWFILGGRGSGKTRAGAEWVRALATGSPGHPPVSPIALVNETMSEVRAVMVEGVSGLLAVGAPDQRPVFDRSRNRLVWSNGAEAHLMAAQDPDRFRGPQFAAAWCDELAKWSHAEQAWDMLQLALRLGHRPRQIVTSTPRPTPLVRRLLADQRTAVTRMRTADNRHNLAPGFFSAVTARYEGTFLGRQELEGELIEDREDALWTRAQLEACRSEVTGALGRTIVAVDPAVSATKNSDACGIIVAAASAEGRGAHVLADETLKPASPLRWAEIAIAAFHRFEADAVVVEINQGGDLVHEMLAQIDADVPVIPVRARHGKWVRAEPVAALYQRHLVRHVPGLCALEDEMCAFGADGRSNGHSPDRVDALVWGLTTLLLDLPTPRVRSLWEQAG